MTIEEFKSKIKIRKAALGIFLVIYAAINIILRISGVYEKISNDFEKGFASSFSLGMLLGLAAACVIYVFKINCALKDEKKLKELCNYENDERRAMIKTKCGAYVILPMSLIITAAGITSLCLNQTVSITLICTAVFQLTTCCILKLYYSKKY